MAVTRSARGREGAVPGDAERLEAQVRLRGGGARSHGKCRGVGRTDARPRERIRLPVNRVLLVGLLRRQQADLPLDEQRPRSRVPLLRDWLPLLSRREGQIERACAMTRFAHVCLSVHAWMTEP